MNGLRIGPFTIINKISDITYEILNQDDGYTSHIHRNHLVPYYPKEPIIFLLYNNIIHIQMMMIMIIMTRIQIIQSSFLILFLMKNNQLKTHLQIPIKKRIFHPQLTFNQYHSTDTPHFHTNKISKKPIQKTNLILMTTIIIHPRRHTSDRYNFRPQPRKDYRLFFGEKDILSFSQNRAERRLKKNSNR